MCLIEPIHFKKTPICRNLISPNWKIRLLNKTQSPKITLWRKLSDYCTPLSSHSGSRNDHSYYSEFCEMDYYPQLKDEETKGQRTQMTCLDQELGLTYVCFTPQSVLNHSRIPSHQGSPTQFMFSCSPAWKVLPSPHQSGPITCWEYLFSNHNIFLLRGSLLSVALGLSLRRKSDFSDWYGWEG